MVGETGDIKKGIATAGVRRQYTGTAARTENSQVTVYLSYAGRGGHAPIDRELCLPKSWTGDAGRCRAAGILGHVGWTVTGRLAVLRRPALGLRSALLRLCRNDEHNPSGFDVPEHFREPDVLGRENH